MNRVNIFMANLHQLILVMCFIIGCNLFSIAQNQSNNSNHTYTVKTIVYNTLVMSNSKILLKNTLLGVKVSIHKGSEKGEIIYAEVQQAKTNVKGNLQIEIGVSYVISGKYANFDPTGGPYFIRLDIDPKGGTDYNINITRPFVNTAKGIQSNYKFAIGNKVIQKRYVGEIWGGGIIFHLNKDSLGNDHGLIASLHDLSKNARWGLNGIDFFGFKNASVGKENTKAMITNGAEPGTASQLCNKYSHDGFKDWYLPAIKEMILLYEVRGIIDEILDKDKSDKTKGLENKQYWTSTGYSASTSWFFSFYNGGATNYGKNFVFNVRAIRAF
ncbi:MAG: DUF1566 domain-containing protein [Crocinitomicaceae bacterium]|jgi:hypothetical protein